MFVAHKVWKLTSHAFDFEAYTKIRCERRSCAISVLASNWNQLGSLEPFQRDHSHCHGFRTVCGNHTGNRGNGADSHRPNIVDIVVRLCRCKNLMLVSHVFFLWIILILFFFLSSVSHIDIDQERHCWSLILSHFEWQSANSFPWDWPLFRPSKHHGFLFLPEHRCRNQFFLYGKRHFTSSGWEMHKANYDQPDWSSAKWF